MTSWRLWVMCLVPGQKLSEMHNLWTSLPRGTVFFLQIQDELYMVWYGHETLPHISNFYLDWQKPLNFNYIYQHWELYTVFHMWLMVQDSGSTGGLLWEDGAGREQQLVCHPAECGSGCMGSVWWSSCGLWVPGQCGRWTKLCYCNCIQGQPAVGCASHRCGHHPIAWSHRQDAWGSRS